MSNQSSSYTSTSYTSTSYTSSSSSNGGEPQIYSKSSTTRSHYNDQDGGTSEHVTHETGKPTIVETTQIPSTSGRQVESTSTGGQGRIEDVTDREAQSEADQRYLEAMEDEYAKREGGA